MPLWEGAGLLRGAGLKWAGPFGGLLRHYVKGWGLEGAGLKWAEPIGLLYHYVKGRGF